MGPHVSVVPQHHRVKFHPRGLLYVGRGGTPMCMHTHTRVCAHTGFVRNGPSEFPGSLVVRTWGVSWHGLGSIPVRGMEIL